jgi:2'-5' RNA ligase
MRLFTAIELPDDARQHLVRLTGRLTAQIDRGADWGNLKFVRPENLHVTLKFLGEVDAERVTELTADLQAIAAGAVGAVAASHVELLPPRGPIRVVAVGLAGDVEGLSRLARAIEQRCEGFGVPREARAFRAHVTLARARNPLPGSWRQDASAMLGADLPGPPFEPAHFTLFRSDLKPRGPECTRMARFRLGDA